MDLYKELEVLADTMREKAEAALNDSQAMRSPTARIEKTSSYAAYMDAAYRVERILLNYTYEQLKEAGI